MNGQKITNVGNPSVATDVVTKGYVNSNYYLVTTPLNMITAATGTLSLNNNKITNLSLPTLNSDAASKLYVD
jgi:hypothetical protein